MHLRAAVPQAEHDTLVRTAYSKIHELLTAVGPEGCMEDHADGLLNLIRPLEGEVHPCH